MLSQNQIRRLTRGLRIVPDQHTAVSGVAYDQPIAIRRDPVRPVHRISARMRQTQICQCAVGVRLTKNDISLVVGTGGRFAPDQHAVVPRVGHGQPTPKCNDPGRHIHGVRSHRALGVSALAAKVGLTQKNIGRCVVICRDGFPSQHPVMPRV